MKSKGSINIRPGVSVLSVLKHLNYAPWYALAEFVDNALQSFQTNRERLAEVGTHVLKVSIRLDGGDNPALYIRDNAAGISEKDFPRAFRPAEVPPDRSGLSEFGMGMKSASCWFAPVWEVRTSALGEPTEKRVVFNIDQIVQDSIEELEFATEPAPEQQHFTEVVLRNLHRPPKGRTVGKIKEHLADIYRYFTRNGELVLTFNGESLVYEEPKILNAPYFKTPEGESVLWRKEIDMTLGDDLYARGFAALRETASTGKAGFSLFRRGRVILGSSDEGYRPDLIFGQANSYTYQRLFGELELEGFGVSHTKDGFQWQESEQTFLELLKEELEKPPFSLLAQAEGFRKRAHTQDLKKGAQEALARTGDVIEREVGPVVEKISDDPQAEPPGKDLPPAIHILKEERVIHFHDEEWKVMVSLTNDPAVSTWVEVSDDTTGGGAGQDQYARRIGVQMSLAHPFMERFGGSSAQQIEPFLRIAVALALAEQVAYDSNVKRASAIRFNVNELLGSALSKP